MSSRIDYKRSLLVGTLFIFFVIFLCFIFFRNTLPSYFQMRNYLSIVKNLNPNIIESKLDSVFTPFTTAQMDIRKDFLKGVTDNYDKLDASVAGELFKKGLTRAEEYVVKRPHNFLFLAFLADIYTDNGSILKNIDYIKKGENHFRRALLFAPNRQDINYGLALNLFFQKKYDESFNYFEKSFDHSPSYFSKKGDMIKEIYSIFFQYFYETKNKDDFIKAAKRLKDDNYISQAMFDQIINYMSKYNSWPKIDFE